MLNSINCLQSLSLIELELVQIGVWYICSRNIWFKCSLFAQHRSRKLNVCHPNKQVYSLLCVGTRLFTQLLAFCINTPLISQLRMVFKLWYSIDSRARFFTFSSHSPESASVCVSVCVFYQWPMNACAAPVCACVQVFVRKQIFIYPHTYT